MNEHSELLYEQLEKMLGRLDPPPPFFSVKIEVQGLPDSNFFIDTRDANKSIYQISLCIEDSKDSTRYDILIDMQIERDSKRANVLLYKDPEMEYKHLPSPYSPPMWGEWNDWNDWENCCPSLLGTVKDSCIQTHTLKLLQIIWVNRIIVGTQKL